MKYFLENGYGVLVIGIIFGIGIMVRIILYAYYIGLGRACKKFETTGNKTITYIRNDLKQREEQNQIIGNRMVYTECRLLERRVLGVRLGVLEGVLYQSIWLVLLSSVLTALSGVLLKCKETTIVFLLFAGVMEVYTFLLLDLVMGLREKNKRVRLYIRDYIENRRMVRTSREEVSAVQEKRDTKKSGEEKSTEEHMKRAAGNTEKRPGKRMRGHGKAQEEKRRLTEELLRERRRMEAKRLVQQRSIEQEENPQRQAQAETAATESIETERKEGTVVSEQDEGKMQQDFSYESILREIIAEYLS